MAPTGRTGARGPRSTAGPEGVSPPSSRRTSPRRVEDFRVRRRWEKVAAGVFITAGLAVVVLNYGEDMSGPHVLPGGHSPMYLLLGVLLIVYGAWCSGVLDRKGM